MEERLGSRQHHNKMFNNTVKSCSYNPQNRSYKAWKDCRRTSIMALRDHHARTAAPPRPAVSVGRIACLRLPCYLDGNQPQLHWKTDTRISPDTNDGTVKPGRDKAITKKIDLTISIQCSICPPEIPIASFKTKASIVNNRGQLSRSATWSITGLPLLVDTAVFPWSNAWKQVKNCCHNVASSPPLFMKYSNCFI